jgi:hypothetical protein
VSPVRILGGLRIAASVNFGSRYRLNRGESNFGGRNLATLQTPDGASKSPAMRPSPGQIERVAESLVRRLVGADVLTLTATEEKVRARFADVLTRNFQEEAEIEQQAEIEAAKLVRQGAPGVRREDVDLRRVEQLMKQRIAQTRKFPL